MTNTPPPGPPGWDPHQGPQPPPAGFGTPGYSQPGYGSAMPPSGPYPQAGYTAPGGMVVAPKSPGVSLIASFFIPGLGSMINGDVGKGVIFLVGYIISLVLTIILIGFIGIFVFWIWGMVDAYNGARLWNARHGIYS